MCDSAKHGNVEWYVIDAEDGESEAGSEISGCGDIGSLQPASNEEWVLMRLQEVMQASAANEADMMMQGRGPDSARLHDHVNRW